jgi:hypothetical protein
VVVGVVLLASQKGYVNGGYFVGEWAPVALILAALALLASVAGAFHGTESRWSAAVLGLFAAYTAWTFASLLWSPNRGRVTRAQADPAVSARVLVRRGPQLS